MSRLQIIYFLCLSFLLPAMHTNTTTEMLLDLRAIVLELAKLVITYVDATGQANIATSHFWTDELWIGGLPSTTVAMSSKKCTSWLIVEETRAVAWRKRYKVSFVLYSPWSKVSITHSQYMLPRHSSCRSGMRRRALTQTQQLCPQQS
jgi:hypothetical protein